MPSLPALGHHNHERQFEIQLDDDTLCLYGNGFDAPDIELKGKVVFCNAAASKVIYVRIALIGKYLIQMKNHPNTGTITTKGTFHSDELLLYNAGTEETPPSLPPSCHEWPFSFTLRGYQLESLKGMNPSFYSYKLKARAGRESHVRDHKTKKPIRIIRTYDPASPTLYRPIVLDKIWEGKAAYTFSMPCQGVVFGSVAPYKFTLVPLVKGLKISHIETRLLEVYEWSFNSDLNPLYPTDVQTMMSPIVHAACFGLKNRELEDINGADGYVVDHQVQIPSSLQKCRLTLDPVLPHDIVRPKHTVLHIRHCLEIMVFLINPEDGHLSTLKAKLHIILFTRPNQKFDKQLNLLNPGVIPMTSNPDIMTSEFSAPPIYGQHSTDQTLDARDPVNSGLTTPTVLLSSRASAVDVGELYHQSRPPPVAFNNVMREVVERLNFLSDQISIPRPSQAAAEDIQPIVTPPEDLQNSDDSSPTGSGENYYSFPIPPGARPSSSRSSPFFLSLERPQHLEYNDQALARVPSYNTAAQQAEPPANSRAGLPAYGQAATSTSQTDPPLASSSRAMLPSSSSAWAHRLG